MSIYNISDECKFKFIPHLQGPLMWFYNFDVGPALIYTLIDIAPLLVYFPLLILLNVNLASGPAQSFVFFYQALPAVNRIDRERYLNALAGGFSWGLLTMQSSLMISSSFQFCPSLHFSTANW